MKRFIKYLMITIMLLTTLTSWYIAMKVLSSSPVDNMSSGCPFAGENGKILNGGEECEKAEQEYNKQRKLLEVIAFQEGYRDFIFYGERKGPNYPKKLMKDTFEYEVVPVYAVSAKSVYEGYYEKGFAEARKKDEN